MKKNALIAGIILIVATGIFFVVQHPASKPAAVNVPPRVSDEKNVAYEINGHMVTLVNGRAEEELAPGSASKLVTQYFGNEVRADLNGDGLEDVAFLMTQDGGGSGTFFYVVAALKDATGYHGTNGAFLGDRIAPQTTEFRDGKLIVNYAQRKTTDPMTVAPSIGTSKYFVVKDGKLVEVSQ